MSKRLYKNEEKQLTIYIPREARDADLIKKIKTLKKRRRSVNYVAVEALLNYIKKHA